VTTIFAGCAQANKYRSRRSFNLNYAQGGHVERQSRSVDGLQS
jgi:hypothetical protein